MSLELAILGFLAEQPRSGYDLKRRCFAGPVSSFWTADQAQIYRTLDRLKEARLVRATRRRQSGRPDRVSFEITDAGCSTLAEELETTTSLSPLRDPFLLQLFFGGGLSDEALGNILTSHRDQHAARLQELFACSAALAQETTLSERSAVLKQTALDGAVVRERALVEWLDACMAAVAEGVLPERDGGVSPNRPEGQTGQVAGATMEPA